MERDSACVKQHELMIEFVVVVSKEPEAVITSAAEPFMKIASFHKMAKCLSATVSVSTQDVCCMCSCSVAPMLRKTLSINTWQQVAKLLSAWMFLGLLCLTH